MFKGLADDVWPSARVYHSLTALGNELILIGGGYLDQTGAWKFYNDVYAFDTETLKWRVVNTMGTELAERW